MPLASAQRADGNETAKKMRPPSPRNDRDDEYRIEKQRRARALGRHALRRTQVAASEVTKAALHLPFKGEWQVFWGGRTVKQNVHIVQQQQRFAYDFARTKDGRMHTGDGTKLDDYYCWAAPILAPANGTVVSMVGDLPDQAIGSVDKTSLTGNFVVLDMGNDEYALMAHLRQNGDQGCRPPLV